MRGSGVDGFMQYEPHFRANLIALARAYAKATGLKFTTISTRFASDSRFFDNLCKRKPGGFTVRIYDRCVAAFRARWPEDVPFPAIWEPTPPALPEPKRRK